MYQTDVLIVGSGPAGSAAALFCSTYGVPNMIVTKYRWLADSPRSHITNQRTLEIFRDMGIVQEALLKASPSHHMGNTVFCTSLAGEELGRHPWGANSEKRLTDYTMASPHSQCDLPQHLLEPILLSNAATRGTHVKLDTEYLDHEQDADGVTVRLMDRLTRTPFFIRAKYLLGADGGNSKVAADLQLPMDGQMGLAGSISIIFRGDLSKFVAHRPGILWWILQPGSNVGGVGMGVLRMVRTWNEWQIIWGYDINDGPPSLTVESATKIAHQMIGDDSIPIEIISTSLWTVNQMYATQYSSGRVFCMGDAVHRHPPTNGLGSNTSIQDAYNLIWKLALVLNGKADKSLLESYSIERVPVGKQIVTRSNQSVKEFAPVFEALGLTEQADVPKLKANMAVIKETSAAGAQSREKLRKAIAAKAYEFATNGVELNIRYTSCAVVTDGQPQPDWSRDPELYYQPSTFPGHRLPHIWLNQKGKQISSLDLAGKGKFILLTGIGGEKWAEATSYVAEELDIPFETIVIGPGRDVQDLYFDWAGIREVDEDGCVVVRPDGYVLWRSNAVDEYAIRLLSVFKQALGLTKMTNPA